MPPHFQFGMLLLLLFATGSLSSAATLQDLLDQQGVPRDSFSKDELSAAVDGAAKSDDGRVVIAYGQVDRLTGSALVGPISVLQFDKASRAVLRKQIPQDQTSHCGGAPGDVSFVDEFILVQTHINPSAGCILALDESLALQKTLYGFAPVRVAPGQIVLIEDMIHFAPVHPERLQLVDLHRWTDSELYPPKGDPTRKNLAAQNAAKMPPQAVCMANNESCDPADFDETIRELASDGQGRFAFVALQEASHAPKEGEDKEPVASQSVLYVYQRQGAGWRYCQQELPDPEVDAVSQQLRSAFDKVSSRCIPRRVVFPDLKTQKYNPFVRAE